MEFLPVLSIQVIGVHDAGIPDQERIVLRTVQEVNLAKYAILLTFSTTLEDGTPATLPLYNFFFWLGGITIEAQTWLVIYTGSGEYKVDDFNGSPVHHMFWGNEYTLFGKPDTAPMLVELGSLSTIPKFSAAMVGIKL